MPVILNQDIDGLGQQDITYVTLDGTDTFLYGNGVKNQVLILKNSSGGAISGTFTGDGAPSNATCQGLGNVTVSPEAFNVLDGSDAAFYLNNIPRKLAGTVSITGGTGLEAALISV